MVQARFNNGDIVVKEKNPALKYMVVKMAQGETKGKVEMYYAIKDEVGELEESVWEEELRKVDPSTGGKYGPV